MNQTASLLRLSVRQLIGGRRMWAMLLLSAIPLIVAVLFRLAAGDVSPQEFSDGITDHLIVSTILPLVMLVLATGSLGNEVDDRTLSFLVLKPISRWTIATPKLLAALLVGGVPVAASGLVATLLVTEGDAGVAATTGFAILVGAAAYAALFTWAGLTMKHALPFGVGYVFLWEAALSTFLGGTRLLSVRQYTLAVVQGLDDGRLQDSVVEFGIVGGLVGATIVVAAFLYLTVRRLERMNVP